MSERELKVNLPKRLAQISPEDLHAVLNVVEGPSVSSSDTQRGIGHDERNPFNELDDLRADLENVERSLRTRPIIGEARPGAGWYERLPEDIPAALRGSAAVIQAIYQLRETSDELKAELAKIGDYRQVERALVEEVVLPGIDVLVDNLNLTHHAVGDWSEQRALIAQGMSWLEMAKRVLDRASGMEKALSLVERAIRVGESALQGT